MLDTISMIWFTGRCNRFHLRVCLYVTLCRKSRHTRFDWNHNLVIVLTESNSYCNQFWISKRARIWSIISYLGFQLSALPKLVIKNVFDKNYFRLCNHLCLGEKLSSRQDLFSRRHFLVVSGCRDLFFRTSEELFRELKLISKNHVTRADLETL